MAWAQDAPPRTSPLVIPEWCEPEGAADHSRAVFHRFATTDIDRVRDSMCGRFRPHAINLRGRPHEPRLFELDEVALGDELILTKFRYNREVTIEAPPLDDFFILKFALSGRCETRQGDLSTCSLPGTLCVLNTTQPIRMDMDDAYSQMTVKIGRTALEQALAADIGHGFSHSLEFATSAQPLRGGLASLARTVMAIWGDLAAAGDHSGYCLRTVQKSTQQTVATLLLSAFPNNFSDALRRPGTGPVPYFVLRAERFIRKYATEPIALADIVRASTVSERALQAGFRRFRATSPTGYLKAVRLEQARLSLLGNARAHRTVAEIALDCGFSHPSKFTQSYKAWYGETPSETVRRSFG